METTAGTLLGGRVLHEQPRVGYRTGIEPVLLAASVPASAGELVIEAGTGAGAGLLCLVSRVSGVRGVGVERHPALAALAQRNAAVNGFDGMTIRCCDVLAAGGAQRADHAMANPPWHAEDSTAATDAMRDGAKRGAPDLIDAWARALGRQLRHRGTLTFVVPARLTADTLAAFTAAGVGSVALLPLWPALGREARIVLVQGRRGGRAGTRLLPGLVLHDGPQCYSAAARTVLWEGGALQM